MKLLKHDEETDQGLENDDLDIIGMKKEVMFVVCWVLFIALILQKIR